MFALLILTCGVIASVHGHSWMTCPPSFVNGVIGRGGEQTNTCENYGENAYVTEVEAGDRLKVGWTSNNHAGGFVRLSLVRFGDHMNENILKRNVMKFVCYGHDTRPHKTKFGDCKHPCDARPGCEYQSNQYDVNRFDTTLTIPTNLPNGEYVLQAAMLVGNTQTPYNSCSKLRIIGGNPLFNCRSNKAILKYSCLKSGGPALDGSVIERGSTRGDFCYRLNGEVGSVDEYIRDVPINVECDPRLSCGNSVDKKCVDEPGMKNIKTPRSHPHLPGCRVYSILPDPEPSCFDGIKNRDEEDIDCGGIFCKKCPVVVYEGDYYSAIEQDYRNRWVNGAIMTMKIHITKNITETQCWELSTQFQVPLKIKSIWGQGVIVEQHSDLKIIKFGKPEWNNFVKKGDTLSISMEVENKAYNDANKSALKDMEKLDPLDWSLNPDHLKFLTALFEVYDDKNKCQKAQATK